MFFHQTSVYPCIGVPDAFESTEFNSAYDINACDTSTYTMQQHKPLYLSDNSFLVFRQGPGKLRYTCFCWLLLSYQFGFILYPSKSFKSADYYISLLNNILWKQPHGMSHIKINYFTVTAKFSRKFTLHTCIAPVLFCDACLTLVSIMMRF